VWESAPINQRSLFDYFLPNRRRVAAGRRPYPRAGAVEHPSPPPEPDGESDEEG